MPGDMAPRRFTLEEADELLPWLEFELSCLARVRTRASEAAEALGGLDSALALAKGHAVPPGKEGEADRFLEATAELVGVLERINARGCLVQDLDLGHVDFPGERGGRQVHLCWHFGEPRVLHFHGTEGQDEDRQTLFAAVAGLVPVH